MKGQGGDESGWGSRRGSGVTKTSLFHMFYFSPVDQNCQSIHNNTCQFYCKSRKVG